MAWVWAQRVIAILRVLVDFPITLVWERLESDETKQVLTLNSHASLQHAQTRSACPVQVIIKLVGIVCNDRDFMLPVPRSPVILVGSANASCLWDAHFDIQNYQPIRKKLDQLRGKAEHILLSREVDSAATGIKTFDNELLSLRKSCLPVEAKAWHTTNGCSLHQQQIAVRSSVKPVAPEAMRMLAAIDAYTRLMNMGNYWMRVILAVLPWVRSRLRRTHEAPAWHTDEASAERRRLIMEVFWPTPRPSRRTNPKAKRRTAEKERLLREEFDVMINGELTDGVLLHHCSQEPGRCQCESFEACAMRYSTIFVRTACRYRTKPPELKEWTAVSQSLRGCGLAALIGGGLFALFLLSINALSSESNACPAGASCGLDLVPAASLKGADEFFSTDGLVQDFFTKMQWKAVAGQRVKLVKSEFVKIDMRFRVVWYAILHAAADCPAAWLMDKGSHIRLGGAQGEPLLFEFLDPRRSIFWAALQFFSAMLGGTTCLAVASFRVAGWSKFEHLFEFSPNLADEYRTV